MSAGALLPWAVRVAWLLLPFAAGPALAGALDGRSVAVRSVASAGLWIGWAVVVVGVLVPHPVSLTALRVAAPAALAACVAAALSGEATGVVPALAACTVMVAVAFSAETGTWMINGTAYGDERRFLLRPPQALMVLPIPLAWMLLVAAVAGPPLLLAAGRWVAGGLALLAGVPLALVLARALHSLTLRWAVLVPAGLVIRDHLALVDPVLLRRTDMEVLSPAVAGADALDLSVGARGLAVEAQLREAVPLMRVVLGRRRGEAGRSARLRFTPTRPGAVLAAAAQRRIPVA